MIGLLYHSRINTGMYSGLLLHDSTNSFDIEENPRIVFDNQYCYTLLATGYSIPPQNSFVSTSKTSHNSGINAKC